MKNTIPILRWAKKYLTQSPSSVLRSFKYQSFPTCIKRGNFQVRDKRQLQLPVSPPHKPNKRLTRKEINYHNFWGGNFRHLRRNPHFGYAYLLKMLSVSYKILLGEVNLLVTKLCVCQVLAQRACSIGGLRVMVLQLKKNLYLLIDWLHTLRQSFPILFLFSRLWHASLEVCSKVPASPNCWNVGRVSDSLLDPSCAKARSLFSSECPQGALIWCPAHLCLGLCLCSLGRQTSPFLRVWYFSYLPRWWAPLSSISRATHFSCSFPISFCFLQLSFDSWQFFQSCPSTLSNGILKLFPLVWAYS